MTQKVEQRAFESAQNRFKSLQGMEPLNFEVEVDDDEAILVVYSRYEGELLLGKSHPISMGIFLQNSWEPLLSHIQAAMDAWFYNYSQVCKTGELTKDLRTLYANEKRIMFDIGCLLKHTYGISSPCTLSLYALGNDTNAGTIG